MPQASSHGNSFVGSVTPIFLSALAPFLLGNSGTRSTRVPTNPSNAAKGAHLVFVGAKPGEEALLAQRGQRMCDRFEQPVLVLALALNGHNEPGGAAVPDP